MILAYGTTYASGALGTMYAIAQCMPYYMAQCVLWHTRIDIR